MALIKRYENNPILTKNDVPYPVATVHNAAVVKQKKQYVMIFRSHRLNGRSILGKAVSSDGFHFSVDSHPFMTPAVAPPFQEYEAFGVEDPRITKIEETFYITYSAYSKHGVRIGLACTQDFVTVERMAFISQADTRNIVLFPQKFNDLYVRLDRPHTHITPWSIWISYSPDLIHWGNSRRLIQPETYHWDSLKIGPGAPPIRTKQGWLHIYHGVYPTIDTGVYRLGVALHDLNDPSRIIGVGDEWILQPEAPCEINGYVHNVVFTCAAVPEPDNTVKIYWGGADTVMCVGTAHIDELVDLCLNHSRNPL